MNAGRFRQVWWFVWAALAFECSHRSDESGSEDATSGGGGGLGAIGATGGSDGTGGGDETNPGTAGEGGAGGIDGAGEFSGPLPTLYWTLDGADVDAGELIDRAGDHVGVVGDAIGFDGGAPVGEAAVFPGGSTESSIVCDDLATTDTFTLSVWLNPSEFPDGEALRPLSMGGPLPSDPIGRGWALGIVSDELRFAIHAPLSHLAVAPVELDVWLHAVAIGDVRNRSMRLYVDGGLIEETSTEGDAILFANAGLVLGYQTTTSDRFYVGALDELALWNDVVLTDAQIEELAALGRAGLRIVE